ncbi:FAD binding domain-containing protein [Actinomadura barringtoniae]|uniref:FAD binding domain-containing protein n=1 Tax=Actinomadura barringtoniae TaxID=1427535 RepID=A0A939TBM9_9ACTN|nr:FAD binding domain-containing protein [Actinomadura barringtoniae]MBO2453712.1 FAD binding domain-containing protein [Actinomadura barringtoniae]
MKSAAFTYHRARDVAGAVRLASELEDAKFIAGGQSLVAMMNFRLARPAHLVDLGPLRPELSFIRREGEGLRIGALTTHHEVESASVGGFQFLTNAMPWIGHLPIRTRGTIGGSLAHGDATAEWCMLALLLDAEIVAEGPGGRRTIPAAELFLGFFTTALEPDEMIVEIFFPHPAPRAALTEFAERRGDFAIVAAAVDLDAGALVLGGVAPAPVRLPLTGGTFAEHAEAAVAAVPPEDRHRQALTRTLVLRACEEAAAQ